MTDKYVLVEHSSSINVIIQSIFQTTQRIKFTAFEVSQKYIVFGVNSGGIYIFHREPCQFLKLIPSTHGSANLIVISENEENLAISVKAGLVIVLEECFSESLFQQQVFKEHEGSTLTSLKWNGNDLYCGDSNGKVSVITLKKFLTKAIFQPPIAVLMNLDSEIVQLDTCGKFLLVSTMTRTLLCDTETERYRQIGKKLREGLFGACFVNTIDFQQANESSPQIRGSFQAMTENESLSLSDCNLKIYCARPGVRLWQADGQANVICTHQFRPSLTQKQTDLIHFNDSNALTITRFEDDSKVPDNFCLGKLYEFHKYVLVFRDDGFYIFNPLTSSLMFWSGYFGKINEVKIVNTCLYIWHHNLEVSVISLVTIEELILTNLLRKHFRLCGQLCLEFEEDLLKIIETSKRIHLISVLDSKLLDLGENELHSNLSRLLQRLKELSKLPTLEKLKTGIVTVQNVYHEVNSSLPESVENFRIQTKTDNDILLEQYRVSKIHKEIETNHFQNLVKTTTVVELYKLMTNFMKEEPESSSWCGETYLKSIGQMQGQFDDEDAFRFGKDTFFKLNQMSSNLSCKCKFPLPITHQTIPKYCESGLLLMETENKDILFQHVVPYLYKFLLEKIENSENVEKNLSLLIQFSDSTIFTKLSHLITYDIWDEALNLLLKLENGICLNCSENIDIEGIIGMTDFALLMVRSINGSNAIKLLKRYSKRLQKGVLNDFFYQYCIFQTVSSTNFDSEILKQEMVKPHFEKAVEGFLRKKYMTRANNSCLLNISDKQNLNCDFCQLSLYVPIIDQNKNLNCGHNFHEVCYLYTSSQCFLCNSTIL